MKPITVFARGRPHGRARRRPQDARIRGRLSSGRRSFRRTQGRCADGKTFHPDVVLMDIAMPFAQRVWRPRASCSRPCPPTKVIILSAHSDDAYVTNATDSGARGFFAQAKPPPTMCAGPSAKSTKARHFFSPSISRRQDRLNQPTPGRVEILNKKSHSTDFARDGSVANSSPRARPTNRTGRRNSASDSRPWRSIVNISWRSSTSTTPPASPATPSAPASSRAACS